jgi:hypothetical protein
MVKKKAVKKKSVKVKEKQDSFKPQTKPTQKINSKADDLLMQNFVGLQKVIVDLSLKLNDLTINLSKLLKLFELSAETLVKKDFNIERENEKDILRKLDSLLEQNKLVARGFTLMHEKPTEENFISQRTNMAPIAFQRTQGGLQQSSSNVPQINPSSNFQQEFVPKPVQKKDSSVEVPGSEEESVEKNDNSNI